jgi:hypothetical protein
MNFAPKIEKFDENTLEKHIFLNFLDCFAERKQNFTPKKILLKYLY